MCVTPLCLTFYFVLISQCSSSAPSFFPLNQLRTRYTEERQLASFAQGYVSGSSWAVCLSFQASLWSWSLKKRKRKTNQNTWLLHCINALYRNICYCLLVGLEYCKQMRLCIPLHYDMQMPLNCCFRQIRRLRGICQDLHSWYTAVHIISFFSQCAFTFHFLEKESRAKIGIWYRWWILTISALMMATHCLFSLCGCLSIHLDLSAI